MVSSRNGPGAGKERRMKFDNRVTRMLGVDQGVRFVTTSAGSPDRYTSQLKRTPG